MKFVLEIDTDHPYTDKNGNKVYVASSGPIWDYVTLKGLEELTPAYINEHFGEKLAYRTEIAKDEGMARMYNAIMQMIDMNSADRMDAFGMVNTYDIITNLSPSEFYAKLTAYEVKKKKKADAEIKVGDEIISTYSGERGPAVVVQVTRGDVYYVYADGRTGNNPIASDSVKKTGRHFPEVARLLEKMKAR